MTGLPVDQDGGLPPQGDPTVPDVPEVALRRADPADAAEMAAVIRAAFGARPRAGRPASGLTETADSVIAKLARGGGYVGKADGRIVAVVLVLRDGSVARLARVCVLPGYQHHGLAVGLVREAALHLAVDGVLRIQAGVRREYPGLLQWWLDNDFEQVGESADDDLILVERLAPQYVSVPDADEMRALGERIAASLRPGDVLIESGELGAGKTTLTQGIGAGLRVDRPIISPTFVLSRVHPSLTGGPALVHVDAYRLGSWDELEDLDLDQTLADAVTVVEWGTGIAEPLAAERLEIDIRRDDPATDVRQVLLTGIGPRWEGVRL